MSTLYIDVCGGSVPKLWGDDAHKYFGCALYGNLKRRGAIELQHRFRIIFPKCRLVLMNEHVALKQQLKLFDAVVSPTVLFGLPTFALHKSQVRKKMINKYDRFNRLHMEWHDWYLGQCGDWSVTRGPQPEEWHKQGDLGILAFGHSSFFP